MKSIKFLMAAALTALTINSEAQLVSKTEGYSRAQASFVLQNMNIKDSKSDNFDTKGFELGYVQGINLTHKMPLFLELGGELVFTHRSDETHTTFPIIGEVKYDNKNTFMSIAIPANVAYKFSFASNNISVSPLFGFNFKVNLIGKNKQEVSGNNIDKLKNQYGIEDYKVSYFDSDEVGDDTASRFQFGLNMGVGVDLGKLFVGYRFQPDLMKYWKTDDIKMKSNANLVSVGFYL